MIPQQTGAREEELVLVRRVASGDRQCFELLVRRHERRVFRVAMAVLGNTEDAEDAVQETFIKAFRHIAQFRGESSFTTWLTRIAVNEALQKRQARKPLQPLDEAGEAGIPRLPKRFEPWTANPEQLYGQQELRQRIETAMQAVPEIYREVLVLRDVEGMTAEEAAQTLGLTIPALKSSLLRARLMLREALATRIVHGTVRLRNMMRLAMARTAGR